MEEFFEKGTLPEEHMIEGLPRSDCERQALPGPVRLRIPEHRDRPAAEFPGRVLPVRHPARSVHATAGDQRVDRTIADGESQSAFVFKTMADPFAGRVTYFKVYSGVLKNDDHLLNMRTSTDERLAHIGVPMGKQIITVPELHAGDIGAVAKLHDTLTGDTLAPKSVARRVRPGEDPRALDRICHLGEVAQRRRPHGQRDSQDPRRRSVAAVLPRPADERVSAWREPDSSMSKSSSAA